MNATQDMTPATVGAEPTAMAPAQVPAFIVGWGKYYTHAVTISDGKPNPKPHAGQPYQTITGKQIVAMVSNPPPAVPKDSAQWFIPSTYSQHDARDKAAQLAHGAFHWLTLDLDENNVPRSEVAAALRAVLGLCPYLIYSTSSATAENLKWRALVPLGGAIAGADYQDTQRAFYELLSEASQGVVFADTSLDRLAQIIYLPNPLSGLYDFEIQKEGKRLDLSPSHPVMRRKEETRAKELAAKAAAEAKKRQREAERAARGFDAEQSPIDAFNEMYKIADLLTQYGYRQQGQSAQWRSQNQTTKSFATKVWGDYWTSLSGSDGAAGLGGQANGGARFGDAFDLYCHYEHGGNTKQAIKAFLERHATHYAPPAPQLSGGFHIDTGCSRSNSALQRDNTPAGPETPENKQEAPTAPSDAPPARLPPPGPGRDESKAVTPVRTSRFFSAAELGGKIVPERKWVVPELVPGRTVTLLSGDGGTGKSLLALQLTTAITLGTQWLVHPVQQGSVIFLSAEDEVDELHRRLDDILRIEGKDYPDTKALTFRSVAGEDALLALEQNMVLVETLLLAELDKRAAQDKPALIVIDTLADVYPSNENDRAKARQFIGMLRGLAIKHDCAVVLLAHPSLSGLNSGAGTSGSTAWNNSVRSRLYFDRVKGDGGYESNADARTLRTMKSNYGKTGGEIAVTWREGVFVADAPLGGLDQLAVSAKAERVFMKLLNECHQIGRRVNHAGGANYAPKVFAEHPQSEGVTQRLFKLVMGATLASGKVRIEEKGPPSRRTTFLVPGGLK